MRGEVWAGRREGMGRRQRTSGMHGERAWLRRLGGYRACAERTLNMPRMVVTLDVSKLSGWLNADADCRVERRAYDAERGVGRVREGMGRRQRTSGTQAGRGPGCEGCGGYTACAERT